MKEQRDIKSYFDGVLENIIIILKSDFYKEEDKNIFNEIKVKIENWYKNYIEENTLKGIEPKELEYIGLEITDFFDKYISSESVQENYAERLLYDFGHLEIYWKEEMIGGKKNG